MPTFPEVQNQVEEKLQRRLAEIEIEEAELHERLGRLEEARHKVVAGLRDLDADERYQSGICGRGI